jgi:hypothetical protein
VRDTVSNTGQQGGSLQDRWRWTYQHNFILFWEYLLHVSTFATTRVALPTGVEPG